MREPDSLMVSSRLFETVHHPGIGPFPTPRSVLEGAAPSGGPPVAPLLGQDTDAVLDELLGLDDDALADLRARSVIGARSR